MAEKTLKTRIKLRYDTLANWEAKNPVLLAGEIAVVAIPSGKTETINSLTAPQILFKVGDGTGITKFKDLPWASGLAADVYNWAKEELLTLDDNVLVFTVSNSVWSADPTLITLVDNLVAPLSMKDWTRDQLAQYIINKKPYILTRYTSTDNKTIEEFLWTPFVVQDRDANQYHTVGYSSGVFAMFADKNQRPLKFYIQLNLPLEEQENNPVISNITNKQTLSISHAKKGPSAGYTSGNTTTSVSAGDSKTIKIPQLTVDTYGHTTAAADEEITISIPSIPSGSGSVTSTSTQVIGSVSLSGHTLSGTAKSITGSNGISVTGTADTITIKGPTITIPTIGVSNSTTTTEPATDFVTVIDTLTSSNHNLKTTKVQVPTQQYIDKVVTGAVQFLGVLTSQDKFSELKKADSAGDFARIGMISTLWDKAVHPNDLMIAKEANAPEGWDHWDLIHGEDVGVVSVSPGTGITVSGDTATPSISANITGDGVISTDIGGQNEVIVYHNKVTTTTETNAASRTYINGIETDEYGHITKYTTNTEQAHQSIKQLDTTATTTQSPSASESIVGTGKITLHKVSKTGSYNDLLNKPTIGNGQLTISPRTGLFVSDSATGSITDTSVTFTANQTVATTKFVGVKNWTSNLNAASMGSNGFILKDNEGTIMILDGGAADTWQ